MAATVATPLERALGRIAGVTEMTSRVLARLDAGRPAVRPRSQHRRRRPRRASGDQCRAKPPPVGPAGNPTYRKVNPADAPIMILALTSDTMTQGQVYDAASTIIAQKLSQIEGVGEVRVGGSALPAVRVEIESADAEQIRHRARGRAARARRGERQQAERRPRGWGPALADLRERPGEARGRVPAARHRLSQRRGRPSRRRGRSRRFGAGPAQRRLRQRQALRAGDHQPPAQREHHRDGRSRHGAPPVAARVDPERDRPRPDDGADNDDPRFAPRRPAHARDLGHARHPRRVPVPAQLARNADPQHRGAGVADRDLRRDVSRRLQPRQPVADGAHHRDRFRRRRRDRRARKRVPAPRGGHADPGGGAAGCTRGRVHRAFDVALADRRIHPHPADGRHHRPLFPRVRRRSLDGDSRLAGPVAHHHADDVLAAPAPGAGNRARSPLCP